MKAVLSGQITSFEILGEVLKYEGTVLCPGTWQGVDGNKITYSDAVVASGAPTFSGVALHEGHIDQTREAVKGFNAVSWYQDGCIRNRGYIWDKTTVDKVVMGEYPMGQSMEAEVYVDSQMNAVRIQGSSIAIGVENPACQPAKIGRIESVKLSMDEDKKKALLAGATLIGEPKESTKMVALSEDEYVQMKALAEKGKTVDILKTDLEVVKTTLGAMKTSNEAAEIVKVVGEITGMDKDFKVDVYCEGVSEHSMKMRMLNAYRGIISKIAPILPSETPIIVKNEELEGASRDVFGVDLKEMFLKKEGS